MIEYLYNAIRATAGDTAEVAVIITDENNNFIKENVYFMLFDINDNLITSVNGDFTGSEWIFNVPTTGLEKGNYYYCLAHNDEKLCFKQAFYLV